MNVLHDVATQLTVDLSLNTGALKHGASGFLYGLGDHGIPTPNMLIPLKPKVVAQKAPNGYQHPNGDAFRVSDMYKAAGGRDIEIYIQDIYAHWPYEYSGLADYIKKVETTAQAVTAHPNRSMFSYVPFNEPDEIWYNTTDKKQAFFDDWNTVYEVICSLDPTARIVGPNFCRYHSAFYHDFFEFCRNNNCLPHITSWHELEDNFFSGWYERYHDYRNIERDLGIAPREIVINEYTRIKGDLGIPGKLVQWITRFENSKVDACLAYWTAAGSLNDLVTHNNHATGGWWLYKWYSGLTGHTVQVAPPDANAEGLDGLGALDSAKRQARVLFGGIDGTAAIVIRGFESAPFFCSSVHVTIWAVDSSGTNPSDGPRVVMEGDYTISDDRIAVPVSDMIATTTYHMIVTPAAGLSSATTTANRYRAEYADISGNAAITYDDHSGAGFVKGYDGSHSAGTTFIVTAPTNGFYNVTLRYSAGPDGRAPSTRQVRLILNGSILKDLTCRATADWSVWDNVTTCAFLSAGINRIAFNASTGDESGALHIDSIEVVPGRGTIITYEAEATGNTLGGLATVSNNSGASGGKYVGNIGNGAENYLQFNHVNVLINGIYRMVVHYANAELVGEHKYNTNVVDRGADIIVNGGSAQRVYFRNTSSWDTFHTAVVDVMLKAGKNTIRFTNSTANGVNATAYAPNIDRIGIAPREEIIPAIS